MSNHREAWTRAKTFERLMFAMLLGVIAAGGLRYEWFRTGMPSWQLVGLIVAGYLLAFAIYRLALSFALKKLRC